MKGGGQKLSARVNLSDYKQTNRNQVDCHSSVSPTLYSVDVRPTDIAPTTIRSVCQFQLEQLATQLPTIALWLVYQDAEKNKPQSLSHYVRQPSRCDSLILYCLEAERKLVDGLSPLHVSELITIGKDSAYICPLSPSNTEYLLLCTYEPLSADQIHQVERYAQLLSYGLTNHQERCHQRVKVQLLEQVLQRTEHQLRNPLAVLQLYAENLRLQLPNGILKEQVEVIQKTAGDMSNSLSSLVSCGQQANLQIGLHNLQEIWIESVQGLQPWLQEKGLQIHYPNSTVMLAIDRWQMKQVLSNLLDNAIHFSPAGGTITCTWQLFRQEVLIEISDQGAGLSEVDLQQAFTPFYSRRLGGTGLGLSIAKKIILDHRGNLWAKNIPEAGAQFSFTLPRSKACF